MNEIMVLIICLSVFILLPLVLSHVFVFILQLFIKNEKFLRITKYVTFGVIFVLELLLVFQTYVRRSVRGRLRTEPLHDMVGYSPGNMDSMRLNTEQRMDQLNQLKDKEIIDDNIYNKAKSNLEGE
jgi:uncharacterized membrane protein